jgi:internalin A
MDQLPRPRRWWKRLPARLSLRVLMIVVLVLGGGLGWVTHRARVQRDAVAAIEKAGGRVVYDWGWKDGYPAPPGAGAEARWPKWLVDALGPDYFGDVAAVYLRGDKADDALMAHVGRLGRLEYLNLHNCKSITDAGLAHLRGLTALKDLDLSFTGATGAGLRHLVGMTRLKKLQLPFGPIADADLVHLKGLTALEWLQGGRSHPDISDAGLAQLEGLVNLKTLSIVSPRITSVGLVAIRDMKRLQRLNLRHCGITDLAPIRHLAGLTSLNLSSNPIDDAGLADVGVFKGLTELHLDGTGISDAGLAHVAGLKELTHLNLDRTKITDAGLVHLAGLTNLQNLWLDHTGAGDTGLAHLARLNKVTLLFLEGTRVTDAGVARLEGLGACEQVAIGGTGVTDAGIKEASQKRPRTRFIRIGF